MLPTVYIRTLLFLVICHSIIGNAFSQSLKEKSKLVQFVTAKNAGLFGKASTFIENIGQYGDEIPGHPQLGKILYGFEGLDMPVLFTTKGIVYLQRKMNETDEEELEKMEEEGKLDREKEMKLRYTDRVITMEWLNGNSNPLIENQEPLPFYHTYGLINRKAQGFKKITYKNVYPGIDVIYSFIEEKQGFGYSLLVHPGADASAAGIQFGGDVKEIKLDPAGDLLLSSDIGAFRQTSPVSFYCDQCPASFAEKTNGKRISSGFDVQNKTVRFAIAGYDHRNTILVDPFVTSAANLTGMNAGIAKDIDFDYDGNIYVSGGGDLFAGQLAKFSSTGNLLWTFNGKLANPAWNFGSNYGGWVVEKTTGNVYLGQGGGSSFRIIRLNTLGQYDNYITVGNPNFFENWKMIWNCDGGTPKIFIAGGGASDNINLGICSPPSTTLTSLNITGQPGGHQDISDMVMDPKTNEMYTLFSQDYIPVTTESNRLYKHKAPYDPTAALWTRLSGFTVLTERANRPYLGIGLNDNSVNMLAVNSDYLFYYDGKNLKAMSKSTGVDVGTPVTFSSNTALMQGGIIADECNNIFIGTTDGSIKVFKFTGTIFDDAAAQDIGVRNSLSSFYDLAYDDARRLLYASAKDFVASVDISSYCAATIYKIKVQSDCSTRSATASISPALPPGSSITYNLYNGSTQVASNGNGFFSNLDTIAQYTIKALIDKECGGAQALATFRLSNCGAYNGIGTGIYVPKAFTPNNDGLNDILKAIPFGIKEFKYFSLYNRWGELVFTTKNFYKGWDGIFKGQKQSTGVYAWIAEAIDFNDKPIRVKGTTVLIR